jgi:hypothetical protein
MITFLVGLLERVLRAPFESQIDLRSLPLQKVRALVEVLKLRAIVIDLVEFYIVCLLIVRRQRKSLCGGVLGIHHIY